MIPVFWNAAYRQVPRLLGLVNRAQGSPFVGMGDREYWHYRQHIMPSARFQEAVHTYALLYKTPQETNAYYKARDIRDLIVQMFRASAALQHHDGSFDEWYKGERSSVATGFVVAAHADAYALMQDELSMPDKTCVQQMLRKGAVWLAKERPSPVRNQESGAIYAIARVAVLLADKALLACAKERMQMFLATQKAEGWWDEYGGPDIGYLSLTAHFLAAYNEIVPQRDVYDAAGRACQFIWETLHADGSSGGIVFSRNTEYLIPSGFVKIAKANEYARALVSVAQTQCMDGVGISPAELDDRYLASILYHWFIAGQEGEEMHSSLTHEEGVCRFQDAGIMIWRTEERSFIVNLKKGGAFSFREKHARCDDVGIVLEKGAKVWYGGIFSRETKQHAEDYAVRVQGRLSEWQESIMTLPKLTLLSILALPMRMQHIRRSIKYLFRALLITFPRTGGVSYERRISFEEGSVLIQDSCVCGEDGKYVQDARMLPAFIPSAKFVARYRPQEIERAIHERHEGYSCVREQRFRCDILKNHHDNNA